MDFERVAVAESLAREFPTLPATAVMQTVRRCVDELPAAGPLIIEQAARARLSALTGPGADAL